MAAPAPVGTAPVGTAAPAAPPASGVGGHLFLFNGDIRTIACDAWLVPEQPSPLQVQPNWDTQRWTKPAPTNQSPAAIGLTPVSGSSTGSGNRPYLVRVSDPLQQSALPPLRPTDGYSVLIPEPQPPATSEIAACLAGVDAFVTQFIADHCSPPPPPAAGGSADSKQPAAVGTAAPAVSKPCYGRSHYLLLIPFIGRDSIERAQLIRPIMHHCLSLVLKYAKRTPTPVAGGGAASIAVPATGAGDRIGYRSRYGRSKRILCCTAGS